MFLLFSVESMEKIIDSSDFTNIGEDNTRKRDCYKEKELMLMKGYNLQVVKSQSSVM